MICIYCGSGTQVTNSRPKRRLNAVWRRRLCNDCKNVFTTVELIDLSGTILFKKTENSIEPFRRDILFISVYESLKHRKDAARAATALTDTVIANLLPVIRQASLQRQDIVKITQKILARFDKVAGVYYQAYHSC